MMTIQHIKDQLKQLQEPDEWLETLYADERKGVQKALAVWQKQYEKRLLLEQLFNEKIQFDDSFKQQEISYIAGVDEAGRGPLAGPVVTAAVILPDDRSALLGVDDSKKISKEQRRQFAELIKKHAAAYAVHIQPAAVIDELNIYQATKQSMEYAVNGLAQAPHIVLADAMQLSVNCPSYSIIKGDEKSLAVAAASILAKTTRDAWMDELHAEYPQYGFAEHAGYGTPSHLRAIETYGYCEQHRKTFEPIKSMRRGGR